MIEEAMREDPEAFMVLRASLKPQSERGVLALTKDQPIRFLRPVRIDGVENLVRALVRSAWTEVANHEGVCGSAQASFRTSLRYRRIPGSIETDWGNAAAFRAPFRIPASTGPL